MAHTRKGFLRNAESLSQIILFIFIERHTFYWHIQNNS